MEMLENLPLWAQEVLLLLLKGLAGFLISLVLMRLLRWYLKRRRPALVSSLRNKVRTPVYLFFPSLAILLGFPTLQETLGLPGFLEYLIRAGFFVLCGWLLLGLFQFFGDLIRLQYDISTDDNLDQRKVITQLDYIEDLARVAIVIIIFALILLQFEGVKQFGTGILASAGVAGIIIGIAAQSALANLLAGFQIAFTQPIRVDDVVVAEGEWGRIEDISLTYVVVRIWDERRLVLPIRYFVDQPFQNWTRTSAELLGTVFLHMDYRVPVAEIREKLKNLLEAHPLWDKRVSVVQVTDSKPSAMEIRLLMSARNSPEAWDLRCDIREQMIDFIRENYPESLPQQRVLLEHGEHPDEPT